MTSDRRECPYCGKYDSNKVNTDWCSSMIYELRVCNNCLIEFVNRYDLSRKAEPEAVE